VTVLGEGKLKELREYFSLLRGNLLIIIVTWAFIEFARGTTGTYYPKYVVGLGAPEIVPGLLQALYTAIYAIVAIIGGYVADRYGRKNIIATFTFFVALSYLLYAAAPTWQWLIVAESTLALTSIYIPALQAMIADSIPPEKRGKGYSLTYLITYLAAAPSALVAGILITQHGLIQGVKIAFLIASTCAIIAAILRSFFLKETLQTKNKKTTEGLKEFLKDTLTSYKHAIKSMKKSLVWLIIAYIIFTFSYAACSQYWIFYTTDEIGITNQQWAILYFTSIFTYPLALFPAGFIVDKIGRKKSWALSHTLFATATIIYLLTPMFTTITITLPTSTIILQKYHILVMNFALFALSLGILGVAISALQADLIPRELRGRTMAAISLMSSFLAMVPGNIYGGYTYQYLNKITPFITLLILNLISLAIIILKVKEPKIKEK
jgi:MFS family permease